jgi:dipeptidyl aminopeptidase/acylaminoacyl peptidase
MARNGVGRTAIVRRPYPPDVYEYDIERYLNVRSAFGASFRADGTLSFRMDTTGTPQVWTMPEAGAWPTQRTFYDERVTFASPSPERAETVFGMDEGGDERGSLFRLDDDGRITELTQPDAKHRWGGWSHDGDRIAFASNRREESVFDVYVQPRDGTDGDARRLLEGDGWLSVAGWSPDDSRLLVHEARSNVDTDVYVLDVASGALAALTGEGVPGDGNTGDEAVRYKSLSWGPDGEYVYCCSDRDGDTLSLVRLDAADGTLETVVDGGTWNVDGVAIDDVTGRIAYSRNADGYTELTVGDLEGERIDPRPDPELPAGIAGGVDFDDGADRFAVTVTTDTHNANVYVVDVETGAAERWTQAPTAGIPESTFVESDPIRYGTFDGREIPGYLSVPETVPEGGAPTIVDVHGGPESQRRPSFSAIKQYFLAHGYAVFEPNVRGSTGYGREYAALDDVEKRMDAVADVEAAAAWLAARPEVDGDRLIAKGGSYGGFVTLAALTEYPDLWAAGVDIVGIANFVTFLENTGSWRRSLREAEYGSLEDDRELLESISPINSIDRIEAPLFVLHGENDPRVPVGEARQVAEAAEAAGVPVETLVFEDEGHGIAKRENRIEAHAAIIEFLDTHV